MRRHTIYLVTGVFAACACGSAEAALDLTGFSVSATRINPGEVLRITGEPTGVGGTVNLAITTPYAVPADQTPPNFAYDGSSKRPLYTQQMSDGSFAVDTSGWAPGLYNLTLEARSGSSMAYRDFAVRVGLDDAIYKVDMEYDGPVAGGGRGLVQNLAKLHNGDVLAARYVTRDNGASWIEISDRAIPYHTQLNNGMIVGLDAALTPVSGNPGYFTSVVHHSTNGGVSASRYIANLHIPDAIPGVAHAPYDAPLVYRSIVEMPDGRLLATMYGRFEGDDEPWRWTLNPDSTRTRAIVVESNDAGLNWNYLSTIAYDVDTGMEGYNETVMALLPDGDLLAMSRTGDNAHVGWEDNPIMMMRSTDGGATWSTPQRTGASGVAPDMVVMSDGNLVASYGRPGHNIMFSADNGQTWVGHESVEPERYRGYTAIVEAEPGVLLMTYRAKDWIDPATGQRVADVTRVRRIRIRKWGEGVLHHEGFAASAATPFSGGASPAPGAWFHDAALTVPAAVEIAPESLSTPSGYGLPTTDGRLIGRGDAAQRAVFTALPEAAHVDLGESQAYYLSLLIRRTNAGDGSESLTVTLTDGLGEDVGFAISSSGRPTILTPTDAIPGAVSVGFEETYLLVGRIVASATGPDAIALRLFREDEVIPLAEPIEWDAALSGWSSDAVLDRVGLSWGTHAALVAEFDELRLATTWEEAVILGATPIPEPTAAALATLGLFLSTLRGRRRRTTIR